MVDKEVLIIDDEPQIRKLLGISLRSEGYHIINASSAREGLSIANDRLPDIILLDLQMPHMGGAEALGHIRSHDWGKKIPVIILTNLGEEEAPKSLRDLGIHSYIVKADLTPRQVVSRVKEALGIA